MDLGNDNVPVYRNKSCVFESALDVAWGEGCMAGYHDNFVKVLFGNTIFMFFKMVCEFLLVLVFVQTEDRNVEWL